MIPSFKQKNHPSPTITKRLSRPLFSQKSGFYTNVSITIDNIDTHEIYYTLDGSIPNKNSHRYTHPINITHNSVLRARAYKDNRLPSNIQTATYFMNQYSTLPIISLIMDEKYLYDGTIGIYTDGTNGAISYGCYGHKDDPVSLYKNFNQNWKRPVTLEYFEQTQQKYFTFDVDISISGQCSRYRQKKSFSFKLNKKYGKKTTQDITYPTKTTLTKISDFKLRTGKSTYGINDLLAAKVVESGNLDIDYQAYRTVQMYMNGTYWGVYNIREKKGQTTLSQII